MVFVFIFFYSLVSLIYFLERRSSLFFVCIECLDWCDRFFLVCVVGDFFMRGFYVDIE